MCSFLEYLLRAPCLPQIRAESSVECEALVLEGSRKLSDFTADEQQIWDGMVGEREQVQGGMSGGERAATSPERKVGREKERDSHGWRGGAS